MSKAVSLELDKPRKVKYNFNSICDFEAASGASLLDILAKGASENPLDIFKAMGFASFRTLLWAGLKHEERGLTQERVGNILETQLENGLNLYTLYTVVFTALIDSGIFKSFKSGEDEVDPVGNAAAEETQE